MMAYQETDLPKFSNDYDDMFVAVVAAYKRGKGIVVKGKSHGTIRNCLRSRAKNSELGDLRICVNQHGTGGDLIVYLQKEMEIEP